MKRWQKIVLVGCGALAVVSAIAVIGLGVYIYQFAQSTIVNCNAGPDYIPRVTPPAYGTLRDESCTMFINPTYSKTFTLPAGQLNDYMGRYTNSAWVVDATAARRFADEAARATAVMVYRHTDGAYDTEIVVDASDSAVHTVYFYTAFID